MNPTTPDILVVGAGVAGLTSALALRREGAQVTVIDQGPPGREASWAGGGILCPLYAWRYPDPVLELATLGMRRYPDLIESLRAETDPERFVSGMRILDPTSEGEGVAEIGRQLTRFGIRHEWHGRPGANGPAISLPDVANVRNPRLLRALLETAAAEGIEVRGNLPCDEVIVEGGRVTAVATPNGPIRAGAVVIAAGAWSRHLIPDAGPESIFPVRGQMLRLAPDAAPGLPGILMERGTYLIPRLDGAVIVGSTVEHAGFDKSVIPSAQKALHRHAIEMHPPLAEAEVTHRWAGLRPGSADEVPILGAHPHIRGLWANTGGYRNGLAMAPATAAVLADLVAGREPPVDPVPYRLERILE
ncbi:MAG: NAD(P)/FAD-dependent oxidoreductase [Pseudomonadota bacterium]